MNTNINDLEKVLIIDLEKAKKGAEIGTIKEFNIHGKPVKYIKTSNGWRPFSKKKAAEGKEDIDTKEKQSAKNEDPYVSTLKELVKEAPISRLKNIIKKSSNRYYSKENSSRRIGS